MGDSSIDDEFINSRAVQLAASKKAVSGKEEIVEASGVGFWPPWPFNHLSSSGKSSSDGGDEENDQHDSGLDFRKDAKLFWRYMSHRARVGARQIQQRKLFTVCLFDVIADVLLPLLLRDSHKPPNQTNIQTRSELRPVVSFAARRTALAAHCSPPIPPGRI